MMIEKIKKEIQIIAEVGVNHNGKLQRAKKLILAAKKCGANFVKFQNFEADKLSSKKAKMAQYQVKNTKSKSTQFEMLKKLELSKKNYPLLKKFAKKNNIEFLSSPFDEKNYDYLTNHLKCKIVKIPSGEINNYLMLRKISLNKNQIIMSTGMSNLTEIADAINLICKKKIYSVKSNNVKIIKPNLLKYLKKKIFLLHCVTDYPVEDKFANLNAIRTMSDKFQLNVGYSDHTKGILAPVIATTLGAKIIEKHLTLNVNDKGPDHKASLNPNEFKKMVQNIRTFEKMLGNGVKKIENCEKKNFFVARKSLVSKRSIKKGEKFNYENLTVKRPGSGIPASKIYEYIGKLSKFSYKTDELIKE